MVKSVANAALVAVIALAPTLASAAPKTALTMPQAQKIALAAEHGSVQSHDLEKEKGRWIFSFNIARSGQVHEVNVDANSGKIVEDSVETAADEAREKQQAAPPRR
jgi:uncharacterized membrane protein YkoI